MTIIRPPRLFAIGGAHIDRRGQVSVPYIPGASNPGTMREDAGGGTFNAVRSAGQRGIDIGILSVRGGDPAGETVAKAIEAAGLDDLSITFIDRATPSYTAILDEHGDVVAALADMGLYENAFDRQLRRRSVRDAVRMADAVFSDANLPANALARLATLCTGKPLYVLAISPAKVSRTESVLSRIGCLFMNRREALTLIGSTGEVQSLDLVRTLRGKGLRSAMISQGNGPVLGFLDDHIFEVDPPFVQDIVDVTGAGDAMAGATVAALMRGKPFQEAMREGLAGSCLTIQTARAAPSFNTAEFENALALVPNARILA
ncbi:MAG: carbohydrate kinase family protein [Phyllobacterium sp.]